MPHILSPWTVKRRVSIATIMRIPRLAPRTLIQLARLPFGHYTPIGSPPTGCISPSPCSFSFQPGSSKWPKSPLRYAPI